MSQIGTSANSGPFTAGRIISWGVFLVLAGIAVPTLRSGAAGAWMEHAFRSADSRAGHTAVGSDVSSLEDRVRAFTVQSRMRGIRAELKLWAQRHGTTPTGSLKDLVGKRSATDPWGRTILYLPPTSAGQGWLLSRGPNPKSDRDDIKMPLALNELR
jgi:hypothetical protein